MALQRRHGDMVRADGGSAANEIIVTGGHVGTHVDALAHVVTRRRAVRRRGRSIASSRTRAFSQLGHRHLRRRSSVGRAARRRRPSTASTCCAPGYGVTADDLQAAADRAGVQVQPGDAVLIGTGWSRRWDDRATLPRPRRRRPRPGRRRPRSWLRRARRSASPAARRIAFEQLPPGAGHAAAAGAPDAAGRARHPHHGDDATCTSCSTPARHEFLFVLAPLQIVGATGSPVRPLALVLPDAADVGPRSTDPRGPAARRRSPPSCRDDGLPDAVRERRRRPRPRRARQLPGRARRAPGAERRTGRAARRRAAGAARRRPASIGSGRPAAGPVGRAGQRHAGARRSTSTTPTCRRCCTRAPSVVPAALAAAEATRRHRRASCWPPSPPASRSTVRLGMAGYDCRDCGNSVFFERGLHATSICGTLGAAAAAAMLLGLDADRHRRTRSASRPAWAPASSRPTAPAARSSGSTAAGRPTPA